MASASASNFEPFPRTNTKSRTSILLFVKALMRASRSSNLDDEAGQQHIFCGSPPLSASTCSETHIFVRLGGSDERSDVRQPHFRDRWKQPHSRNRQLGRCSRFSLRMAEASTWSHLPDGAACVPNRVGGHLCYQRCKASFLKLRQILQHSRRRFDPASVDDRFQPWPWWRRPCLTAGGYNAIEA